MEGTLTMNRTSPPYTSIDLVLLTTNDVIWSGLFLSAVERRQDAAFQVSAIFIEAKKRARVSPLSGFNCRLMTEN